MRVIEINSVEDLPIVDQIEYAEWDAAQQRLEYEKRPWEVICNWCDRSERTTQKQLEASGWLLNRHGEFCPAHNYEVHGPDSEHEYIFRQMREEAGSATAH